MPRQNPNQLANQPQKILEFRSFDGTGNNISNPTLNSTGETLTRIAPANFVDGIKTMQSNLPNARTISNLVIAGEAEIPNAEGLSGMMYAWGQFIDHDLDLMRTDGVNKINIAIPSGDPVLTGSFIPMSRTVIDPLTGIADIPAAAINNISGWLDGSQVYGSDSATATSLRNADGYMLTSTGNNLPIINGKFIAGDIRVGENPDLTALQTLFIREHNRQVDLLKIAHLTWSGDQLYNQARAIVSAEIAHITYSEFLPNLLGNRSIARYQGYDPNVDPTISEEFAGAAFRFGHSIVSANLQRIDEFGNPVGINLSLKDAFNLAPSTFISNGGADAFLRKLAGDLSNSMDVHIVDDLRNFLDIPGVASMDLAAINIQRGRDLGLGSLNQTRAALGLTPYTSFTQISSDPAVAAALEAAYGNIDNIDLWIGGLAEDHVNKGMVGETFQLIIADQFEALRDGDRLWYENQGFDRNTLNQINNTSLSDLIKLNTDTKYIQAEVFEYSERRVSTSAPENPLAPQLIIGVDGIDNLIGGDANDILVAGLGNQKLKGGAGRDKFVLIQPGIQAQILDFSPGIDQLVFEQASNRNQLNRGISITRQGANTLLNFGGSDVTLIGILPHQIRPGDFGNMI